MKNAPNLLSESGGRSCLVWSRLVFSGVLFVPVEFRLSSSVYPIMVGLSLMVFRCLLLWVLNDVACVVV